MRVLGIETSCDETGVAVCDDRRGLLAHALHSQVKLHAAYGGVVPELASRDHVRKLVPMIRAVLADAGTAPADIDGVAYTAGPGLIGALLVGASVGRSLAMAWNVPVGGHPPPHRQRSLGGDGFQHVHVRRLVGRVERGDQARTDGRHQDQQHDRRVERDLTDHVVGHGQ